MAEQPRPRRLVSALLICVMCFGSGCGLSMFLHLKTVELGPRLRVLEGGGGNSLILTHGTDAFIADVKMGDYALRLRHQVEVELGRKVQRILLTHAHFDHAGGLFAFDGVPVVLVHPNARARLEKSGVRARLVEVEREVRLTLSGEEVQVLSLGSGHTDGDLVAYLPGRKLLVTGDLFCGLAGVHVTEADGGDVLALAQTLQRLAELDVETVVPGHGDVTGKAELARVAAFMQAMREQVQAAKDRGLTEDETARQVTLPEFPDVGDFFGLDSREKNVRRMYKALGDPR